MGWKKRSKEIEWLELLPQIQKREREREGDSQEASQASARRRKAQFRDGASWRSSRVGAQLPRRKGLREVF